MRQDFPFGAYDTFHYDSEGQWTGGASSYGNYWIYIYDDQGRLAQRNSSNGDEMHSASYIYNDEDLLTGMLCSDGGSATFSYFRYDPSSIFLICLIWEWEYRLPFSIVGDDYTIDMVSMVSWIRTGSHIQGARAVVGASGP